MTLTDTEGTLRDQQSKGLGNKPGWRINIADARQDAKEDAYLNTAYENENAWRRGPIADDAPEGEEGAVCIVKNDAYPDDFGSPGHIIDGVCQPDNPRSAADSMSLDALYAEVAKENATAYLVGDPQAAQNNPTRDARPPAHAPRPLHQQLGDHEKRMARVYAEHAAYLRDAYKG